MTPESTIYRPASKLQVLLRLWLGNSHQRRSTHVVLMPERTVGRNLCGFAAVPRTGIELCTEAASVNCRRQREEVAVRYLTIKAWHGYLHPSLGSCQGINRRDMCQGTPTGRTKQKLGWFAFKPATSTALCLRKIPEQYIGVQHHDGQVKVSLVFAQIKETKYFII